MRFEAKELQILSGNSEENEMILSFGMSFPLGYKKKKIVKRRVRRVQPPRPIIVSPPPMPIIVNEAKKEQCPKKINGADRDRDGVEDRVDQCPNTPCGFVVDGYGCPIKLTLRINFAIGSARIEENSIHKIANFATFLLRNRGSVVRVIGHTDSVGTDADNLALSIKRANAVVNKLLEMGVSPVRISAEGRGERQPLVSNDTNEGKSKNRRIGIMWGYPIGYRGGK
ncbi:Outer membrane protein A precursor [hydrothermal vent metagenome]|uniref:Outer membrane protein A n=1 Tax=hydrothermal vent metagenome TaxID=652676 RepID=A0A1W1CXZ6_9ZZZZ